MFGIQWQNPSVGVQRCPPAPQECDHSNNERLEGAEIEEFLRRLLKRPELEELFHRYSGEDRVLSAPELLEFLQDQGEAGASLARAQQLIQTYELNETGGRWCGDLGSASDLPGLHCSWQCRHHDVGRREGRSPLLLQAQLPHG